MIRSMRPVILAAASSRWPLPLVALGIASIIRVMDPGRVTWLASDMQSIGAVLLYGALVPVLVIALASTWLRGDEGPWAWALARPVTRARWLRTTLLIDIVTVLTCIALARAVIGPLPEHWIQAWMTDLERAWGYAALLVAIYSAAAFGGARGTSAIGGALCVVAYGAFAVLLNACAAVSEMIAIEVLAEQYWFSFNGWRQLGVAADSLETLPSLLSMTVVGGFAFLAIRRTALALPQRPRVSALAGLATIALSIAVVAPWVFLSAVLQWFA